MYRMPSLGHLALWQWPDQSVLVETSKTSNLQGKLPQVQEPGGAAPGGQLEAILEGPKVMQADIVLD